MNLHRLVCLALVAVAPLALAQESELKTAKEKVSYGFGLNVGRDMLRGGIVKEDLDLALVMQGVKDALAQGKYKINEKEFEEAYQAAIAPKLPERAKAAAAKLKKESEAFLVENKKKKGVKTTASGLQYRVLKTGSGKTPKLTDSVRAQYKGTFVDGTVFDQPAEPVEFKVKGVIEGWTEGLQLMKEGDKFEFVVPAELGYGEKGLVTEEGVQLIPPNSTLTFELELVQVVSGTAVPRNATKPGERKPE
jgi:FKBP-type peptidyl-prolyl cis-trans isomerase